MSIKTVKSPDGAEFTLAIAGRFDYGILKEFTVAYRDAKARKYIVDLTDCNYIDSSALGMLLNLREHAEHLGGVAIIINASDTIKELFSVTNFSTLFKIN